MERRVPTPPHGVAAILHSGTLPFSTDPPCPVTLPCPATLERTTTLLYPAALPGLDTCDPPWPVFMLGKCFVEYPSNVGADVMLH